MSARHDALLWSPAYLSAKFLLWPVSIFMQLRCRHDANEIPLRTRRARAILLCQSFHHQLGRTLLLFFSLRSNPRSGHILRHLAAHTHFVSSARPAAYYSTFLCLPFPSPSSFFSRSAKSGSDSLAPDSTTIGAPTPIRPPNAQVPLLVTAGLYLAPPSFWAPFVRPNHSQASTPQVPVPSGRTRHFAPSSSLRPPTALCPVRASAAP
ncbi:hypothetical protein V8C26DRAFT_203860 [Trichoderma gracile]